MGNLKNKIAVVTGGTSGVGYATAKELAAQDAQVIITGRNKASVENVATELNATGIVSDQGDLKAIDHLVKEVVQQFGKVDILFINAGVVSFAPIELTDESMFDTMMDINFKGLYFTLSKFIPYLNKGASVILLSSVNGTTGMANASVYSASKAAIHSLVKVATTELSSRKIRVNAVSPGPIDTPLFGKVGMDEESLRGFRATMSSRIPVNRFGRSEEVAKLVSFLASDDAAYINGAEYVIDGGLNVNPVLG